MTLSLVFALFFTSMFVKAFRLYRSGNVSMSRLNDPIHLHKQESLPKSRQSPMFETLCVNHICKGHNNSVFIFVMHVILFSLVF